MTHISTSAHKDNLIYEKGIYHRKRGAMCAITYAYMQIYIYISDATDIYVQELIIKELSQVNKKEKHTFICIHAYINHNKIYVYNSVIFRIPRVSTVLNESGTIASVTSNLKERAKEHAAHIGYWLCNPTQ